VSTDPRAPHIVHVIRSLEVGGLENGVVNLVSGLADQFRHTILCLEGVGPLRARVPASVDVLAPDPRIARGPLACLRLARVLRRLRPDVVHSRNWPTVDAIPGARLAGVPAVVHGEHGREEIDPHGLARRRNVIRRVFAPLVDEFVTVSDDLRRWLVETVHVAGRKVRTIHNGVDTRRFSDQDREGARRALGIDERARVVGTVGRLDPVKDHATLVRAFAGVVAARPEAVLAIVGDGPCRAALETLIAGLGLGERVRLLGARADVASLLGGFDVFALPSIAEGISNTVLEAMATGLPVVATRVGGNPELVEDGVNGRLVPSRDPAALSEALESYLSDPLVRALHGKASRQRAVTQFDLPVMLEAYRTLYASLARRRPRPGGDA